MKIARPDLARLLLASTLWHAKILTQSEFANILTYYIRELALDNISLNLYLKSALLKYGVKK